MVKSIFPPRNETIIVNEAGVELDISAVGVLTMTGSVTFPSTQNVSAVFPSSQKIDIDNVEILNSRISNLAYFDKSSAFTKGDTPLADNTTHTDATEYSDDTPGWTEVKDWGTITFADIASGITTSLKIKLRANINATGAGTASAKLYEDTVANEDTLITDDTGTYPEKVSALADITATSGTFGLKTYLNTTNGIGEGTRIKNQVLEFYQFLNESTINDTDIGSAGELFLKSITLPQDCTVKLDDDVESILTNSAAADKVIDYSSSPVQFSKIEILAGSPSFVLVEGTA